MNAPAKLSMFAPKIEQPVVAADLKLLMSGYNHDGLYLDLYGHADEDDGCEVMAVTVHGASVDISSLLTLAQTAKMGWAADRAALASRQSSAEDAAIEAYRWHQDFANR